MVRRICVLLAMMTLTIGVVSGCEGLRQAIRSGDNDQAPKTDSALETDPTKIQAVDADARNPKPFFQNNRASGGWSSEAREIESHLGVGP